jgi:hypothetical protein
MTGPRHYRFGDASAPGVLLGLPPRQAVPVVCGIGWMALCLQTPLALPGGLVGLAVACLVAFGRWRGTALADGAVPAASIAFRASTGRRAWHKPPLLGATTGPGSEAVPPLLAGLELVEAEAPWGPGQAEPMAVVCDRRRHLLTAVIPVSGRGFPLAAGEEQDRMLGGWGAALSPFARDRSPVTQLTWQAWAGPADHRAHASFLTSVGVSGRAASDHATEDYLALIDQQAPHVRAHDVLVSLTIDQRRVRRGRASRLAAGLDALTNELRTFRDRLELAGLDVGAPVVPARLTTAIRLRSDPTRAGQIATLSRSLAAAAGRGATEWGPMTVEPRWGHVRVDGSWHRTYRVAAWPQLPVPAGWLSPLLTEPTATRTVTVVMEPVPLARSARAADREAMAREADADSRGRRGFRVTARERKRLAEVEARERELAEGHAEFRFTAIVNVTGPTQDALYEATAAVEQAAAQSLLDLRPLDARHEQGWVASLPLGRNVASRGPGR